MKFVFCIFAFSAITMFALAQETTTPPPRVYPVALPNYDEETATRLQIFLDNSDFGPGKIDGRMGEFFRKALISYKHAHAMPKTGAVDQWMLDQVPVTYTTYTMRDEDLNFLFFHPSAFNLHPFFSGRRDSNPRPLEPHSSALPSCATARFRGALLTNCG